MKLVILGAGGYGRTIADIAAQMHRYDSFCFLDDSGEGEAVAGKCEAFLRFRGTDTQFYPAFGNNDLRLKWLDQLKHAGCSIATIIHPSAYISPTAVIDEGTAILPKSIVNTDCHICRGCILNLGAIIDHGCIIEEGAHICLGAIIKAENRIPGKLKIQAGVVIEDRTYPL